MVVRPTGTKRRVYYSRNETRRRYASAIVSLAIVLGAGYVAFHEPSTPDKGHSYRPAVEPTPDEIRAKARVMYGQDEIQWKCLDALWTMESHWNFKAKGAMTTHGRALGIAQALPAHKMQSSGLDYKSNPMTQVKWGLRYIKTRYKNKACYALRHELLHNS